MTKFCSGFGQYHTNEPNAKKPKKKLTPYIGITLEDIRALVDHPQQVEKKSAQWMIPSTLMSRTFKKQEEDGQFLCLWADIDKDAPPLNKLAKIHSEYAYEIYTSRSATSENPKCRLLLPLSRSLSGADWMLCQEILNDDLAANNITPDRATERAGQLCYLPNRGEYYDSHSNRDNNLLDPLYDWGDEIEKRRQALVDKTQELQRLRDAAVKRRKGLVASGELTLIEAFNQSYSVPELLLEKDYDQRGNTFRHPGSASGSYSASVKEDAKGVLRVHSLSSSDPLYTEGGGVGAHDAFSVFTVLHADGEINKALKLAGNEWLKIGDESWNMAKQRREIDAVAEEIVDAQTGEITVRADPMSVALLHNPTQDNVALVFARAYDDKLRYAHLLEKWFLWDGTRWKKDQSRMAFSAMRDVTRRTNSEGKANIASANFCSGVETFAKSAPEFSMIGNEFDQDNYLLNTPAGTYDLRSNKMRPHRQEDHLTKITAVAPMKIGGKRFKRFLLEIFGNDEELINFIKVALGAILSGAVENHWLMFWTGSGRNGKNTLGDLVMYIMGDYAKKIGVATLMATKHEAHPTELASLLGVRLATSSEINDGAHWNESRILEVTGDEVISARFMKKDFFEFTRTHKHLIYGNHRPQLRSITEAIKARLVIVPFKQSFVGREDFTLPAALKAEAGFVLNWLIEGHAEWLRLDRRLPLCAAVNAETEDYFDAQSTLEMWISECCKIITPDERTANHLPTSTELYKSYREWKEKRGEPASSQTRWGENMAAKFEKIKSNGVRYRGLHLITDSERLAEAIEVVGGFPKF